MRSLSSRDARLCSFLLLPFIIAILFSFAHYGPSIHSDQHEQQQLVERALSTVVLENGAYLDTYGNASHLSKRDQYSCKKGTPCKQDACCGSFLGTDTGTCGLGPTFCGSDCDSKCNAKAECGQYADPPGKTCPLNVCCSQYGFCGSTSEFCTNGCQSNCVVSPPVPPGKASKPVLQNKVIGYYEGWAARSKCHGFVPAQIPAEGLTHVNFAFAFIDPGTYQVVPMDAQTPEGLFADTTDIKTLRLGNSDLRVFVSIGGWTFSDNGTATQPLLSEIAADGGKRQKFADNLVNFMVRYGFDGVDLDWEYPGAPDRGGLQLYDVINYVELMKTLKQTFKNSARGDYGLSFTIPSSYWYLRWFNVPELLKYADWTNLMSYDLHGTWDAHNPIGSIVQAHTNLTEIKYAMDLLWRNNVRPEQVVLGVGFYGRSFQLSSSSCSTPGCAFKGPADAGSCTDNPGTLAYFEIMDIIKNDKPNIIHDKDAAAKYFIFGVNKDQWISYDDKDTFKAKVDWANSVGLGGLMIWSVDQDDDNFSALEGLLGKSLPANVKDFKRKSKVDSNHWTSLNGQGCVITDCQDQYWKPPPGFVIVPHGAYWDTCPSMQRKFVYCPINAAPTECNWRGSGSCHGQCHAGEVTLAHSPHGDQYCLAPGMQALCCVSNTWSKLVASCRWTRLGVIDCDKDVPYAVNTRWKRTSIIGKAAQSFCCPYNFENCHWVGQGTCDDNECGATDVEVVLDPSGDGDECAAGLNGRQKSLCCNAPKDLNFFLPAPLEDLFPTLPPASFIPAFDKQELYTLPSPTNPNDPDEGFFSVIIDGPADKVTNLNKRDGSHIQFVTGPVHHGQASQTAHFVCMDYSATSNCDDIYNGGLEGTIVRLPDELGFAQWGVVHDVRPSNYSVPRHLLPRAPADAEVFEMEYSYNFEKVKRDGGDVYFRADYSNDGRYYESVVKGKHQKRGLERRFWSKTIDKWRSILESIRSRAKKAELGDSKISVLLVGENHSGKECASGDGFLSVRFVGSLYNRMSWGYSLIGKISPFSLEEAYGYFDSNILLSGELRFDGKGYINTQPVSGMQLKPMLTSPMSKYNAQHPGIISFVPQLDTEVALTGAGEIDGKFSINFEAGSSRTIYSQAPPNLAPFGGDVLHYPVRDPGSGKLWVKDKSSATAFGVNLVPEGRMQIKVMGYNTNYQQAGAEFAARTPHAFRIAGDVGSGKPGVWDAAQQGSVDVVQRGTIQQGWDDGITHTIGSSYSANLVLTGGDHPDERQPSDVSGHSIYQDYNLVSCSSNATVERLECTYNLFLNDSGLVEPSPPYKLRHRDADGNVGYSNGLLSLIERGPSSGGEEAYHIVNQNSPGEYITIRTPTYPNGDNGRSLDQEQNRGTNPAPVGTRYTILNALPCDDTTVTVDGQVGVNYQQVDTEHPIDRSILANQFFNFIQTGNIYFAADGSTYTSQQSTRFSFDLVNRYLTVPYHDWIPAGQFADRPDGNPIVDIVNALGSTESPNDLTNLEHNLNVLKGRVYSNSGPPVADDTWNAWLTSNRANAMAGLSRMRSTIAMFNYMNDITPERRAVRTVMRDTIRQFDTWFGRVTGRSERLLGLFDEFWREYDAGIARAVQNHIRGRLNRLEQVWTAQQQNQPATANEVLRLLRSLRNKINTEVVINQ